MQSFADTMHRVYLTDKLHHNLLPLHVIMPLDMHHHSLNLMKDNKDKLCNHMFDILSARSTVFFKKYSKMCWRVNIVISLWSTVASFRFVASANPAHCSRQSAQEWTKRHFCQLQKLDYSNKKITLPTTPTSTKTKQSQCLSMCGD